MSCVMANTSIFRFHGQPILPPLISEDDRETIRKFRQEALRCERKHQEAKDLKYSKLVGQVKNVLERIEYNRENKTSKPPVHLHDSSAAQVLHASRLNMASSTAGSSYPYPTSSTPFLHTETSTDMSYSQNLCEFDLVTSSMASTIRPGTGLDVGKLSVLEEFMDLPQAWTESNTEKQGEKRGKSPAQRQLKMDTAWESSYHEYQQEMKKDETPKNNERSITHPHEQHYPHAPFETTHEQFMKGPVLSQEQAHVVESHQYSNLTLHQPEDEHELSDKENCQAHFGSRYEHPSGSLKHDHHTPIVAGILEEPLDAARQTESLYMTSEAGSIRAQADTTEEPTLSKSFAKLTACAKGYLTRALFKTNKVQAIIKTVEDTWSFSQDILKDGPKSMQERVLQERVSLQMRAAKEQLSYIFHTLPVSERMEIISISRQLNRDKQIIKTYKSKNEVKANRLSAATMKAMQRRQHGGQSTVHEKPAKNEKHEKHEKPEPKQPVHIKPKSKEPVLVKKRTEIRVLKPIQSHSSPRLPPKTTKTPTTSVNTQVQTGHKQSVAKRATEAVEKKVRANTVPKTNSSVPRTNRQLSARQLPVTRRIAAVISGNSS